MAEVTKELVAAAGLRIAEILTERLATEGKEIASFLNHVKAGKKAGTEFPLGTIKVSSEGNVLHIRWQCELAKKRDISSGIADVSLDAKLPGMEEAGKTPPQEKTGDKKTGGKGKK